MGLGFVVRDRSAKPVTSFLLNLHHLCLLLPPLPSLFSTRGMLWGFILADLFILRSIKTAL